MLPIITGFESIYLLYMFFIFKTTHSYRSALLDREIQGYNLFRHDTGMYENKVCMFGKVMAIAAIVLFVLRLKKLIQPTYVLIFDIVCILLGLLLNLNTVLYIIPLIFCEIFIFTYY